MTHQDLNPHLLWSHCLSSRLRGRDASVRVADACCGIQSQNFQESLCSLWARIDGFHDSDALSELKPGGGLVRTWAIRSTMHIIPSSEYYTYVLGGAGERILARIDTLARKRDYPTREDRKKWLYGPLLEEIKGRAVTEDEVKAFMRPLARRLGLREGVWTGIGDMAFSGLLVHAGRKGSRGIYMRSDDWIPRLGKSPNNLSCRLKLLRKYLARHGPAYREDMMYWAYLTRQQLDEALTGLTGEISEIKLKNYKEPMIRLAKDPEKEVPEAPAAIVLPKYDSLMLTLKDKSRFMDMKYYKLVFGALGMVRPTVLIDGFVSGIWRKLAKKNSASIEVHELKKTSNDQREAVEQKFSEYGRYLGVDVSVKWGRGKWVHQPSR